MADRRGEAANLFEAFVLSALIEETAKWVMLLNVLHVARLGLDIGWGRAIFAGPAHALFRGVMSYYAGRSKFDHGVPRHPRPRAPRHRRPSPNSSASVLGDVVAVVRDGAGRALGVSRLA